MYKAQNMQEFKRLGRLKKHNTKMRDKKNCKGWNKWRIEKCGTKLQV